MIYILEHISGAITIGHGTGETVINSFAGAGNIPAPRRLGIIDGTKNDLSALRERLKPHLVGHAHPGAYRNEGAVADLIASLATLPKPRHTLPPLPSPINYQQLSGWRAKNRLTREQAAALMGVGYPTYCNWENGKLVMPGYVRRVTEHVTMQLEQWDIDHP